MGRAAGRDARPARAGRGHPHHRPVSPTVHRAPSHRAVLHARRVRRAAPPRSRDGLSSRRSRPISALELPCVGAGGASDRHPLDRSSITMATATAQTTDTSAQRELEHRMLRQMLLIRRFEEKAAEAYALGKIGGFCHLYIGQEALVVASLAALREDDYVISSYREHGQALARGVPANALMAELFGKATGCSKGKGGSMHLFDAGRRFMGGHGIVGGHIPLAAGLGFAIRYKGRDQVCICYFGEAAVNIGAFHETLNMASVYKLPVIFVCENNRYGMGAELVNGMDVLAVYEATRRAAGRARNGGRPTLLEVRTYRFMGHSMSDPLHGVYRTKEEVEEQRKRDPISQLAGKLKEDGVLDEAGLEALDAEARAEAEQAVRFADESPDPDPGELTTH